MRKPQTDTDTKFQWSGVGDGLEIHGADRAGFEASVGDTRPIRLFKSSLELG